MILFATNDNEKGDAARAAMREAAPKFKGKLLLAEADFMTAPALSFAEDLSVTLEMEPVVRLVKVGQRELKKYKPKDDNMELTPKSLYRFYN